MFIVARPDHDIEGRGRKEAENDVASWRRRTDCSPCGRDGPLLWPLAGPASLPPVHSHYQHHQLNEVQQSWTI